jgi:hypothetical protein
MTAVTRIASNKALQLTGPQRAVAGVVRSEALELDGASGGLRRAPQLNAQSVRQHGAAPRDDDRSPIW